LGLNAEVIGLDGKECKLGDLKKNQLIRVTTSATDEKVPTKVEAIKKEVWRARVRAAFRALARRWAGVRLRAAFRAI